MSLSIRFRPWLRWRDAVRYFLKHLVQRLSGRFLRFGYAAVNFGVPLSLDQFSTGKTGDMTKQIGKELIARIRGIVPVLPVPLVATCLLDSDGNMKREELTIAVRNKIQVLVNAGVPVPMMEHEADQEIDVAINHLLMRQIIQETPAGIAINSREKALLEYYAASIAHLQGAHSVV